MDELKIDLINKTLEQIHYSEVELQRIVDNKYHVSYENMIDLLLVELDKINSFKKRIDLIAEYFVVENNVDNLIEKLEKND